jgi:hypothetical protein
MLLGSAVAATTTSAAVLALADVTRTAGGNVYERQDLPGTISNEVVYLVGTVTWLANASGGNVTVAWNIDLTTDTNNRNRIGFGSNGSDAIQFKTSNSSGDGDGAGPATAQPAISQTVDTNVGAVTSYTFVMKTIQTKGSPGGDWWFGDTVTPGAQDGAGHFLWIDPNLTASEASQPTPQAGWRSGNNGYKSVSFATNGNTGTIEFTNFAIYTGGDTPFDAIPEPSTALLGALGLLALLRRRR